MVTWPRWVTAVLYNGLGCYDEAREGARLAAGDPAGIYVSAWALPELIEAAARSGNMPMAEDAVARLADSAQAGGTDWGLGIEARSRALVTEGQAAEGRYQEAIDRLGRTQLRPELARAHLLYGEWLRRENRRTEAREQLRTAHGMFDEMGMEGFAERARRELLATGETVRKRTARPAAEPRQELTAQEMQVAQLARDGSAGRRHHHRDRWLTRHHDLPAPSRHRRHLDRGPRRHRLAPVDDGEHGTDDERDRYGTDEAGDEYAVRRAEAGRRGPAERRLRRCGPAGGPAVMLLHGWPYDIHSFADVTPLLASAGYRVIVPFVRGYGTTRFLSDDTLRNGQQAALAAFRRHHVRAQRGRLRQPRSRRDRDHNYRWRLGLGVGESRFDDLERRLAGFPAITVPTITLEGDANGAPHPDASAYAGKFTGKYEHRVIESGIGHNLRQEAPQAFAQAIIDADSH